ncbi:hypothetical protein TNCV_2276741 [Trichonephila clavipes]|nr:hypothetical protein TNCV_2276741 [Trichonephila clavipes]
MLCLPNGQAFGLAYHAQTNDVTAPTENNPAMVLSSNHKILEANSESKTKLGGHQACLSINRLGSFAICVMTCCIALVGTTAPGHHDCSIQE